MSFFLNVVSFSLIITIEIPLYLFLYCKKGILTRKINKIKSYCFRGLRKHQEYKIIVIALIFWF